MTQGFVLPRIAFALTLVATQSNAKIDSDSILAFLRLVMKKSRKFEYFHVSQVRRNATQRKGLVSYCEPGLSRNTLMCIAYCGRSNVTRPFPARGLGAGNETTFDVPFSTPTLEERDYSHDHRYCTPCTAYRDWKRRAPLHIYNGERKVDLSCAFSGRMN